MLRRVFYNSLAPYNIRLIEGWSGAFGINDRAFTLANTIYLKGNDPAVRPDILVTNVCTSGSIRISDRDTPWMPWAPKQSTEMPRMTGRPNWQEATPIGMTLITKRRPNSFRTFGDGQFNFQRDPTDGDGCFYDLEDVQSRFDNGTAEFIFPWNRLY